MGRKLNISQPVVINTELSAFDESFTIQPSGSLDQWYYDNNTQYAPNRLITPLILTPQISVVDLDSKIGYTPTFNWVKWYVEEWDSLAGEYVKTLVETINNGTVSLDGVYYYIEGNNLIIRRNVSFSHAVTIECEAQYRDPRDAGITYKVVDQVTLTTNKDATVVWPEVAITSPSSRSYNPLIDNTSTFTFEGTITNTPLFEENESAVIRYNIDGYGTEEVLPNSSLTSAAPKMDIRYGYEPTTTDNQFTRRATSGGQLEDKTIDKAYVENIKGDTVKVVQLSADLSPTDHSGWDLYEQHVFNSNGTITVTPSADWTGCSMVKSVAVIGHKYLVSCYIQCANIVRINFGGVYITQEAHVAMDKVTRVLEATDQQHCYFWGTKDAPFTFKNLQIFDLTLMGIDNLTTVEEVEAWLTNHIGNIDYIPYTPGKLVNYGGYAVKWNQLCKDKEEYEYLFGMSFGTTIPQGHKIYLASNVKKSTDFTSSNMSISLANGADTYGGSISYSESPADGQYHKVSGIITNNNSLNNNLYYFQTNKTGTVTFKESMVIDLTLMFGEGNEPDLDWCNKWLSRDYYEYCPSVDRNILDVMEEKNIVDGVAQYSHPAMGMKTVGFNQWDEQWVNGYVDSATGNVIENFSTTIASKNLVPVVHDETYYFKGTGYITMYDANQAVVGQVIKSNDTFDIEANVRYIRFHIDAYGRTYNHDICINISDPAKNGTYEPYWSSFSDMSWIRKIGIENFNIWDEEWEVGGVVADSLNSKNFISVSPSTTYYFKTPESNDIFYYDANHNQISTSEALNTTFTTPVNCAFIKFRMSTDYGTTYNHDICINKSISAYNGKYLPHGETMPYFPQGLCNVGNVYDEIKVEDGKIKGVVRLGSVDLGSLTWTADYTGVGTFRMMSNAIAEIKGNPSTTTVPDYIICAKYLSISPEQTYFSPLKVGITIDTDNTVRVYDESYNESSSAAAFKSAMNGVMLYYELETPYEFEITIPDRFTFVWYGLDENDTEVDVKNMLWYVSGQNTDTLTVDSMYGEHITAILRAKFSDTNQMSPSRSQASITWRTPDIDVSVVSHNGGAVRSITRDMKFSPIVNVRHNTLSDDKIRNNLRFLWKYRKSNSSLESIIGWGREVSVDGRDLINTRTYQTVNNETVGVTASSLVYSDVYLLGAYEKVFDASNEEEVTQDNEVIVYRPVN